MWYAFCYIVSTQKTGSFRINEKKSKSVKFNHLFSNGINLNLNQWQQLPSNMLDFHRKWQKKKWMQKFKENWADHAITKQLFSLHDIVRFNLELNFIEIIDTIGRIISRTNFNLIENSIKPYNFFVKLLKLSFSSIFRSISFNNLRHNFYSVHNNL